MLENGGNIPRIICRNHVRALPCSNHTHVSTGKMNTCTMYGLQGDLLEFTGDGYSYGA